MVRKIMLPIDGSDNSQRAFDYYLEQIKCPDDHLLLVHVQSVPSLPSFSMSDPLTLPTEEWAKIIKSSITDSKMIMEHYQILCEEKKIKNTPMLGHGKPGERIMEFAKDNDVTLIVVGSRGLNAVRRTFLGSVSDYIVHHSQIPVLVVPPTSSC